jgi:hypothetical protein
MHSFREMLAVTNKAGGADKFFFFTFVFTYFYFTFTAVPYLLKNLFTQGPAVGTHQGPML